MSVKDTTAAVLFGLEPKVRGFFEEFIFGTCEGAPTDGVTGGGKAEPGSLILDVSNKAWYRNAGSTQSPQWLPLGGASQKLRDDEALRFGNYTDANDESVSDARFWYDATEQRFTLTSLRSDATTNNYERGFHVDLDGLFIATGARKSWGVTISGDRASAVMGGDANDMLLKLDYTNYAVTTPAGAYSRGLSVQVNNRTTGVLSALQGGFIGARQRSTGGVGSLEGLQIDCKIDSGMAAATEISGLRVELNLCANSPAASYGVVVRNLTDGNYTEPTAAFKAINDGTSACEGFDYGLDLMSAAGVSTVRLGEIRLSAQDANNLPCVIFAGTGTDDATIVADIGADTLWADGSMYLSVVDGGGLLFQKRSDTWTSI